MNESGNPSLCASPPFHLSTKGTWHCVHQDIEKAQFTQKSSLARTFSKSGIGRRQFRTCNLKAPKEILLEPVSHVLNFTRFGR